MSIGRSARRMLIVCTATTACGALGAGPAAAASTNSTDLLGLGKLLGSLTQPSPVATNSTTPPPNLGSTLSGLPVLGPVITPVITPVVKALPLLGSPAPAKPATVPTTPKTTPDTSERTATVQPAAPSGSTWTAPRTMTVDPAPVAQHSDHSDPVANAGQAIKSALSHVLPATAAGKAELGAAAVALIILGGVAVAGAAGAAGAAGRRQFIGGPW
jgi:hypothetical protein